MNKFSDILLDNLEEMEFLTKILESAYLCYSHTDKFLGEIVHQAQFHLLNATLDFAIDLDHKINKKINKDDFVKKIIENLQKSQQILETFPAEKRINNFDEITTEIGELVNFSKDYAFEARSLVANFTSEETRELNNKILIIKSRRRI